MTYKEAENMRLKLLAAAAMHRVNPRGLQNVYQAYTLEQWKGCAAEIGKHIECCKKDLNNLNYCLDFAGREAEKESIFAETQGGSLE